MDTFPTFCHISEYGEAGYADLHHMILGSLPLNLWAPSSLLLRSPKCRVPQDRFVQCIEKGYIRITGRYEWLTDRRFRDKHGWEYAPWVPEVDGTILSILRNDEAEPDRIKRRVVVAEPEQGYARADEDLGRDPELGRRWEEILRSQTAMRYVPSGTLETALREAAKPGKTLADGVRVVLRDAHNHGRAIGESGAQVAFLLQKADHEFLTLLSGERLSALGEHPLAAEPAPAAAEDTAAKLADVARQLIEYFRHLEAQGAEPEKFIGGEGHELLVAWYKDICDAIKYEKPANVKNKLIRELQRDLRGAKVSRSLHDLGRSRSVVVASVMSVLAPILDSVGAARQPTDLLTVGAFAAGTYAVGDGALKGMGWVPSEFNGPQWPFIYRYRGRPTKRRLTEMQQLLNTIELERQLRSEEL